MRIHSDTQFMRELHQEFEEQYRAEAESEEEIGSVPAGAGLLRSVPFAGDAELQAVAEGRLRLGRPNDSPYPLPIRSFGTAVQKVQRALLDLGYFLPHGDDGQYGPETYGAVLAYKQQFDIRTQGGYLDGIVGEKTIAHLDSRFPPAPREVDCAGWEGDPQSFSKRAAEHYLRREWQPSWSVQTIACSAPPPNWVCEVAVETGTSAPIRLTVQLAPADKLVRVSRTADPRQHMVCFFSYRCVEPGALVFSDSSCPAF